MSDQMNPEVMMLAHTAWTPWDPDVNELRTMGPVVGPSYFGDWKDETMTWKDGCYIFANLQEMQTGYATGPDVIKLLSDFSSNSYAKFPVGRTKHCTMTDNNGNIIMHGLVLRIAEDKVWMTSVFPFFIAAARSGNYDVTFEDTQQSQFIIQLGGPRTLEALEAATGDDLHDIPFLGFKYSTINGKKVMILRMTMAGTLGYEVHGDIEYAYEIYNAVLAAGKDYGMRRIGWLGYHANGTEDGMPQESITFASSVRDSKFYMDGLREQGIDVDIWPGWTVPMAGSSSADNDMRKYYRNPVELGWGVSVSNDHDYPGRDVLVALKANPKRKTVTLVWELEDILDIVASHYQKEEEPYRWIDYPVQCYHEPYCIEQDDVYDDKGNLIGWSNNVSYTYHSRALISLGTIDVEFCEIGTEVKILWGVPGHRQKLVRAKVAKYPFLDMPSNYGYDIESIPRVNKK